MQREIREVSKRDRIVILTNFNSPHIEWANVCSGQERETGCLNMLNDCALEQFLMEPNRGQVSLDLTSCGTQELVRDENVTESLGNSVHAAISFAMHAGRRVSCKSDTKILDFRRVDFPQTGKQVRIS